MTRHYRAMFYWYASVLDAYMYRVLWMDRGPLRRPFRRGYKRVAARMGGRPPILWSSPQPA